MIDLATLKVLMRQRTPEARAALAQDIPDRELRPLLPAEMQQAAFDDIVRASVKRPAGRKLTDAQWAVLQAARGAVAVIEAPSNDLMLSVFETRMAEAHPVVEIGRRNNAGPQAVANVTAAAVQAVAATLPDTMPIRDRAGVIARRAGVDPKTARKHDPKMKWEARRASHMDPFRRHTFCEPHNAGGSNGLRRAVPAAPKREAALLGLA